MTSEKLEFSTVSLGADGQVVFNVYSPQEIDLLLAEEKAKNLKIE